jgi:hypothetical protein
MIILYHSSSFVIRDQRMSMLILTVFDNNIFNSKKQERYQITTEKIKIKKERSVERKSTAYK